MVLADNHVESQFYWVALNVYHVCESGARVSVRARARGKCKGKCKGKGKGKSTVPSQHLQT